FRALSVERLLAPCLLLSVRGLVGEYPPWVELAQERGDVERRPHPRRVPDLQVEAAEVEGCGEVELPVEEPLLPGDLGAALQPRSLLDELRGVHGAAHTEHHLDRVELLPVPGAADGALPLPAPFPFVVCFTPSTVVPRIFW